jgi:quercetin dioxygenase-like cupin family protein
MVRAANGAAALHHAIRENVMRRSSYFLVAATAVAVACTRSTSITVPEDPSIVFAPAPGVFNPGAQMAVLQGDPSKAQPFTIRLRMPAGYRIAPHTHPTDEHVTVISGTFRVGMGNTFNAAEMKSLPIGGFGTAPAGMAHYAETVGETTVQVTAVGPFALTYVNPADMPKALRQ